MQNDRIENANIQPEKIELLDVILFAIKSDAANMAAYQGQVIKEKIKMEENHNG